MKLVRTTAFIAGMAGLAGVLSVSSARADAIFTFLEVGPNVTMTSSGTVNTANLLSAAAQGWGGVGIEQNGNTDIMGSTGAGAVEVSFGFHPGTGTDPQERQKGCMHTFVMCVTRLWDPVGRMNCALCKGMEWVCANHPDKPFYNSIGRMRVRGAVSPCPVMPTRTI